MIDLVAEMFLADLIDIQGKFNLNIPSERWTRVEDQPAYLLVTAEETLNGRPLVFSQVDLDILLRSKAAMYTILTTLVQSVGYSLPDIERFYIAGEPAHQVGQRSTAALPPRGARSARRARAGPPGDPPAAAAHQEVGGGGPEAADPITTTSASRTVRALRAGRRRSTGRGGAALSALRSVDSPGAAGSAPECSPWRQDAGAGPV